MRLACTRVRLPAVVLYAPQLRQTCALADASRPVWDFLPLLGNGQVLELGCGNGKLLKPLLAAGVDAIGVDISWHILSRLPPDSKRVLADAAALPFTDGCFSAVLDIHCTGHLLRE